MNKHYVLMRDVITRYHPEFKDSEDLKKYGLKYPKIFNVERLIEESLAQVGGYNFVDETGRDFDDSEDSDSKTATVLTECRNTVQVGSVENKIGSLRITIYNPVKDRLDFMYIPRVFVAKLKRACYGKDHAKQRLQMSWTSETDNYNQYECFRVDSFEELARMNFETYRQKIQERSL